jgi:hypothetical protein
LQQLALENQELKMEKHNKERELEIDEYNAVTQRIRALSDHEVDNQKQSLDAINMLLKTSKDVDELDMKEEQGRLQERLHESTLEAQRASAERKTSQTKSAQNG